MERPSSGLRAPYFWLTHCRLYSPEAAEPPGRLAQQGPVGFRSLFQSPVSLTLLSKRLERVQLIFCLALGFEIIYFSLLPFIFVYQSLTILSSVSDLKFHVTYN